MPKYSLVIIPIAKPLLVGLYKDDRLIDSVSSPLKTSDILLPILLKYIEKYPLQKIIYTRGPGSYMAIKLTYIMLKTIEMTRGISCVGCSGFMFNGNQPIKAIGNLYFIKEKETIITKKYEQPITTEFVLPQSIENLVTDEASIPMYSLPAV